MSADSCVLEMLREEPGAECQPGTHCLLHLTWKISRPARWVWLSVGGHQGAGPGRAQAPVQGVSEAAHGCFSRRRFSLSLRLPLSKKANEKTFEKRKWFFFMLSFPRRRRPVASRVLRRRRERWSLKGLALDA